MAKMLLEMIMNETSLNLHELLYGGESWDEICDSATSSQTYTQSKYSFNYFAGKEMMKCPLVPLIKSLGRIVHYASKEENIENNEKRIRTLSNVFLTLELLISIRSTQHKGKTFQVFTLLAKSG